MHSLKTTLTAAVAAGALIFAVPAMAMSHAQEDSRDTGTGTENRPTDSAAPTGTAQETETAVETDESPAGETSSTASERMSSEAPADHPFAHFTPEEIIGESVENEAGETLGDVDRVVMQNGEMYAVVGVGGFLGIGEKKVLVPLDRLEISADGATILLAGATGDSLKAMPEVDRESAQDLPGELTIGEAWDLGPEGWSGMQPREGAAQPRG